jgi:hypothetical protein
VIERLNIAIGDVSQEERAGLVADIAQLMGQIKPLSDQWFDIVPKTSFEFEMGEKLSKIKAIRGLTPKKDMPI